MNKQELLGELRKRLASLPQTEIDKTVAFYDEMVQDRMEDGMTEEEAVAGLGSISDIVDNCLREVSIPTIMVNKFSESKRRAKNKGLWTFLIILGSPVWFPLLLSAGVVIFSVYIVVWSLIVSFYAVEISLAAGAVLGVVGGVFRMTVTSVPLGLCFFGAACICAAGTLLFFRPMIFTTKGLLKWTKNFFIRLKSCLVKKEEKNYA